MNTPDSIKHFLQQLDNDDWTIICQDDGQLSGHLSYAYWIAANKIAGISMYLNHGKEPSTATDGLEPTLLKVTAIHDQKNSFCMEKFFTPEELTALSHWVDAKFRLKCVQAVVKFKEEKFKEEKRQLQCFEERMGRLTAAAI